MEPSAGIVASVLGAAVLHAAWNAMIKSSGDKLLDAALVCLGGTAVVLPFLPFAAFPAEAAWPWLGASVVIHVAYFFALVAAYKAGDLSHGYPIMRGLAPLVVALAALAWFGETVRPAMWMGIVLICGGVLSLGLAGFDWRTSRAATGWACLNAVIIAGYTLVDAAGARASGDPVGYVFWMYLFAGAPFGLIVLAQQRGRFLAYAAAHWRRGLIGGACSALAYGVVVWAMTRAPVAVIAALRECSVVLAALFGSWVLKEGHVRRRVGGALAVLAGLAVLRI